MTLWMVGPLQCKGPTIQRVIQTFVAMASNTTDQVLECRQLLANFFHDIKHAHARWSPIVLRESSSNASDHGLSSLMAPDYNYTYLLLMMICGLIIK